MEETIQWYPLPEVKAPGDGGWGRDSTTVSRKTLSTQKHVTGRASKDTTPVLTSAATSRGHHSSFNYSLTSTATTYKTPHHSSTPSTMTPAPGELSITTLLTASANTSRNSSTNIHSYKPPLSRQGWSHQASGEGGTRKTPLTAVQRTSHEPPSGLSVADSGSLTAPRLTLAELDQLWQRFLASSLATAQPRKEDTKARCTCGAERKRREHDCRREDFDTCHHSGKENSTKASHGSRRRHRPTSRRREELLQERAVQTSPQPIPRPHPLPPAVMFSVPPTASCPSNLTLSESLAVHCPEFIQHSLERQRQVRERRRDHEAGTRRGQCRERPTPLGGSGVSIPHPSVASSNQPPVASGNYPKVSMREMYRASKRVWQRLPEVRAKVIQEKRKSEAATNRLRVKLYQQEVLSRLRRKKNM